MKKYYTSYEEVNRELEILRLEREISIRKMGMNAEDIAEHLSPEHLLKQGFTSLTNSVKNSQGIKTLVITSIFKLIFNKFFKRK